MSRPMQKFDHWSDPNGIRAVNQQVAVDKDLPMGIDSCHMCHGLGYLDSVSGPVQCACTVKQVLRIT